jgi:hypothetical protein
LHPQLSAAALAQLPSQLVELQLSNPHCEATQLVAHVQALRQVQSLTIVDKPEHDADDRTVIHEAAWADLKVLKRLDFELDYECGVWSRCVVSTQLAAGIASATSLTGLRLLCSGGRSADVDVVAMLAPLKQLESLQLCIDHVPEHGSFGDLFLRHITRLRRLTLGLGRLRQVALAQLCFQAIDIEQLVALAQLESDAVDDAGLELIGHSMMPLQQLAICNCGSVTIEGSQAALRMPSLRRLRQLAYVDGRQVQRSRAARLVGFHGSVDGPFGGFLEVVIAGDTGKLPQGVVGCILPLGS